MLLLLISFVESFITVSHLNTCFTYHQIILSPSKYHSVINASWF